MKSATYEFAAYGKQHDELIKFVGSLVEQGIDFRYRLGQQGKPETVLIEHIGSIDRARALHEKATQ